MLTSRAGAPCSASTATSLKFYRREIEFERALAGQRSASSLRSVVAPRLEAVLHGSARHRPVASVRPCAGRRGERGRRCRRGAVIAPRLACPTATARSDRPLSWRHPQRPHASSATIAPELRPRARPPARLARRAAGGRDTRSVPRRLQRPTASRRRRQPRGHGLRRVLPRAEGARSRHVCRLPRPRPARRPGCSARGASTT